MDVTPWRETLDAMTQPGGWIGNRDDKKAALAYEVLAGYAEPNGWIKRRFLATTVREAAASLTKPGKTLAKEAAVSRDAILGLAVLHELWRWHTRRQRSDQDDLKQLVKAVVQVALNTDLGLRAKAGPRAPGKPYAPTDFAHGPYAKRFFEEHLRSHIVSLTVAGVGIAHKASIAYDSGDESSILAWGRLWTAAAVLALMDRVCCGTALDGVRAIWRSSTCFHPEAVIPTAGVLDKREPKHWNNAKVELRTRAAIAYALAGSETLYGVQAWAEPHSVDFRLKTLHSRSVGGKTYYDGYRGVHLYLAVFADCLHIANRTTAMTESEAPPAGPAGGQSDVFDELPAIQRDALAQMPAVRKSLKTIRTAKAAAKRFFPGGPSRLDGISSGGPGASVGADAAWKSLSQGSLSLLPSDEEPGERWQPIGSVEIWPVLGPGVAWVDLVVAVRINKRQLILPVTMEDMVADSNANMRSLLVLDEAAGCTISADALRHALLAPDALVGVVVRKSLGAFVVLEIDMEVQPPAASDA